MAGDKTRWEEFNSIVDTINLDIKEKGLLLIIFRYVNYRTGYANPSRTLIKKLTGISDNRTLDKIFDSLIEKGFLVRESGKGTRSKYFIKVGGEITSSVKNEPSGEITLIDGGKSTPRVGGKITSQKENKRIIKENIDYESIQKIISLYPGRKAKDIRDRKLPGLIEQYGKEQMIRCVERYSKEVNGRDKQYILNESTFWNGRYQDYLDSEVNLLDIGKGNLIKIGRRKITI